VNGLRVFASVSRLHIVAIASLGTFTFGWMFTGRYHFLLAAVTAFDWFLVNLLNRAVDAKEDALNEIVGTGTGLCAGHRRAILGGGITILLLSIPAAHLLAPAITPFRVASHLLGLAYNFPLRPGGRRLKQLYFWKNTASALGFMGTVFAYPLATAWNGRGLDLAGDLSLATLLVVGLFFFLFELSYEVIYDLRDAPGDAAAGVRTYPVVHGEAGAVRIIDSLILLSIATLGAGFAAGVVPWRMAVMIFAPLLQLAIYKHALRRGITAGDCIGITWVGAALLGTYHLWVLLELPGVKA
jgi:4-hydroxybenzoate polyprenyltransferase